MFSFHLCQNQAAMFILLKVALLGKLVILICAAASYQNAIPLVNGKSCMYAPTKIVYVFIYIFSEILGMISYMMYFLVGLYEIILIICFACKKTKFEFVCKGV